MPNIASAFTKIKYAMIGWVKKSPALWAVLWQLAGRFSFLLPHDASYYGLAKIARPEGGLIFDIGANNGVSALGFHKILPNYRIFSIEANPVHREVLERIKKRLPSFDYRLMGASDSKKATTLYVPRVNGYSVHTLASSEMEYVRLAVERDFGAEKAAKAIYERHTIELAPLDTLGLSPDIIKIDIEGQELAALQGLSDTIEKYQPAFLLEFTPHYFPGCEAFLRARGYEFYVYEVSADAFSRFDARRATQQWGESPLQVNVFCMVGNPAIGAEAV